MRKRKEKKKGETYIFFKELTSTSFIFFFFGLLLWVTLAQTHECMYVFVCVCERCDHL